MELLIMLSLPITIATSKIYFSKLKSIKNDLITPLNQGKTTMLVIISIEL